MNMNDPWRVGVLFSSTGPTAAAEAALLNGTLLAIEKINAAGGVRGRQIVPVQRDPAANEAKYREFTRQLTKDEGISVIFGGYTSAGRKAMIPGIEKTNSLLFYPTFYEGFEYSEHVFYFGSCPNQYTMQLVDYMIDNFGLSFYLVGANYVFPRESNRIVRTLVKQRGGNILGERYLPLSSTPEAVARIVRDIEKKQPDVVFSVLVGNHIVDFYQAYAQTNLRSKGVPIASIVTTETEIRAMGPEASTDHYCASSYFSTIQSPDNDRFLADFAARFGEHCPVDAEAEAAYNQMMIFASALAEVGTLDSATLRAALFGRSFEAPQGRIWLHNSNHHTHLWSRIGVVRASGEIEVVSSSNGSIIPDPYLINYEYDDVVLKREFVTDGVK